VRGSLDEQTRLLDALDAGVQRFDAIRGHSSEARDREAALQTIADAVQRFEELYANVQEGISFWQQLADAAAGLKLECEDMLTARQVQRTEVDLGPSANRGAPGAVPPPYDAGSQRFGYPEVPGHASARDGAGPGAGAAAGGGGDHPVPLGGGSATGITDDDVNKPEAGSTRGSGSLFGWMGFGAGAGGGSPA
jgi:hypothetical protein